MKIGPKIFLIVLMFLLPGFVSEAKIKQVSFVSESWVHATEKDGSGLYWDIFRDIFENEGIKFSFKIWSYTGSVKRVQAKMVDAAVGAYIGEVENVIYPKNHFAVDVVQVLYKKGQVKDWQGQKSIEGKSAGWIKGYSYDDYLQVKVKKSEYDSREDILRVLSGGRIEFYIDAESDIKDQINAGKIDLTLFEMKELFKLKLYVVFINNDRGKELSEIFDRGMERLKNSGKLKKMFDEYIINKKTNFTYPF